MPNKGGFNRRTGKTTPRTRIKTHWGAKGRTGRSPASGNSGKSRVGSFSGSK